MTHCEDPMAALRMAVVEQACLDWCDLYRKRKRTISVEGCTEDLQSLTDWFYSDEFRMFCDWDPDVILEQLKKNCKNGFAMHYITDGYLE